MSTETKHAIQKRNFDGVYVKTTTTITEEELHNLEVRAGGELVINGQLYGIENVRRSFGEITISGTAIAVESTP